ncbi:MAG TPA: DUF2231 domain-containing protein [Longimicrobium sp.]|nr:DUF2231 domain-containing protein [Longimicrobium sp.]
MPIGLQEMHPAVVHFPIAFLPLSLGADALGRLTGDQTLLEMGRRTMSLAALGAVNAAVFGLVAQQAVRAEGQAHDLLVTHRTLNAGLVGLTTALAIKRARRRRPGLGYLALGAAAWGVMGYSAYLGGRMAYAHGVGVKPAGGVNEPRGPEIGAGDLREGARIAAGNLAEGAVGAAREYAAGKVAPAFASADKAFDHPKHDGQPAEPCW